MLWTPSQVPMGRPEFGEALWTESSLPGKAQAAAEVPAREGRLVWKSRV